MQRPRRRCGVGRHGVRRIIRRKAFETHVFSACRLVNWLIVLFTLALNRVLPISFTTNPPGQKSKDEDARVAGGGARGGGEFVSLRMLDAAPLHVDTLEFVQVANSEPIYIHIFSGEEETSDQHISILKHT